MVAFLKDPSGPPLWEENPEAKDIVHIETEKVSSDLNNLLGFLINYKEASAALLIEDIQNINVDTQLL